MTSKQKRELRDLIAKAIKQRGWSQRRAAEELGICQPNLCDLLNGRGDPRMSTVDRIIRGLGLELDLRKPRTRKAKPLAA